MKKPNPRGSRIERRRRNNLKAALRKAHRGEGHHHRFRPVWTIKRGGEFAKMARAVVRATGLSTLVCHCGVARLTVNQKGAAEVFGLCQGAPGAFARELKASA